MMSLELIQRLAAERGEFAAKHGLVPVTVPDNFIDGMSFADKMEFAASIPNIGDLVPKGYKLVDRLFVDKSGFGQEDEPALTFKQFLTKIEPGTALAIIEEGQFQVYIGVFEPPMPKSGRIGKTPIVDFRD